MQTTKGYIQEDLLDPRSWICGGYTGIKSQVWQSNGNWDASLPMYEPQRNKYFDTMACVSFSNINVLETLIKKKWKMDVNFSDRALAKMSFTGKRGNTAARVNTTIVEQGLAMERTWPFDTGSIKTWNKFYETIPISVILEAGEFLNKYKVSWDWVFWREQHKIKEALRYSPLAVAVYAWARPKGDIYPRTEHRQNHFVELYGYKDSEYWKIYDHYTNSKKKLAWDFNFGAKVRWDISLNKLEPMPKYHITNNTLVFCAEGRGEFGLVLDDKIIVDDLAKVMAQFLMRNNGRTEDKVKSVTKVIWDSFPKINLKKQSV